MADNARERHMQQLQKAKTEMRSLHKDTPHRRDLLRYIHRMEKELRIYDFYRNGVIHDCEGE